MVIGVRAGGGSWAWCGVASVELYLSTRTRRPAVTAVLWIPCCAATVINGCFTVLASTKHGGGAG